MDNNPFRNQQSTGNAYSSPLGGQAQQQNQFQYQYQQQQQPQQQQQFQAPQQQALGYQQTSAYGNMGNNGTGYGMGSGMQTTYTPSGALSPAQQQAQWQQQTSAYQFTPSQQQSNTDLLSNTQYSSNSNLMSPTGGYTQQQQFTSMPAPYGQQGYGQNQYMQQDNSNFYIPPNFGMNTTTTTTTVQQQGPRHPPVDASSLLKGTQVRRVECPICSKMIEGDDMAINHHVNQHLITGFDW